MRERKGRNAMQIDRRAMLSGLGALAAAPAAAAPWEESRYPDQRVITLDKSFEKYLIREASVEKLHAGTRWGEGPVWMGDWRSLLWSDIPNNRILRWDEETGLTSVFRAPSNFTNGNTRDRQGRLISCEHLTHALVRTEYDGSRTVLIDRFEGKRLNSPNDVVVKSDDSIWFSDLTAGISSNYQGEMRDQELPVRIYRLDAKTGQATVVTDELRPNGLCFSPDEKKLYSTDNTPDNRSIRVFDVVGDGARLANNKVFVKCEDGTNSDGFRCDVDGNIWAGWGYGEKWDGVMVFNPEGKAIGQILLPERCANLCFGGRYRHRLFMAASKGLYSLFLRNQGAKGG
jgi:gluconolactonase